MIFSLFFVKFLLDLMGLFQCMESIYHCRWHNFLLRFSVYLIRGIHIWLTTIRIYFMAIVTQQMNIIKYKITTFYLCFQPNFIYFKKRFKKFFDCFICFIVSRNFYVITLWMYYMHFIIVFRRNKVNCYC